MTFASGGSFSKYSHEFQTITEAGEDIIYVDEKKHIAINKEVFNDDVCKDLGIKKEDLKEKKAVEVGNIFSLGTRFSDAFELFYSDEKGEKKPIVGDQVLTVLGQRVRDASKRSGDLLVRYGGDEIVMVYPVRSNKNITDQELIAVVERTRNEINTGLNIKIEGEAKPITVALGHTIYRVGETNATQLIYEADLAQIIEKEEGRKQERIKKAKEGLL
jgi:diguanylate cyclase (GGDEF)-like protein